MPCQISKQSHAFCVQGGDEWAMWAYGDNCPVEEMLKPGFFNPGHTLLRVGDLVLMGSVPRKDGRAELCRSDGGRKLLAMVASMDKAQVVLRVLIDFGGPTDGDLMQAAAVAAMMQGMMGVVGPGAAADAGTVRGRP